MTDQNRIPVFELHIRPMFRILEREHMAKWVQLFDLWDINAVWQHRHDILTRVRDTQDMPGNKYGGPWPLEWVQLFERWAATGTDTELGHHLILANTQDEYEVISAGGEKRRLKVKVSAPTKNCRAWFELVSVTPTERAYTLYLEPAYPKEAPNPVIINALEGFIKGSEVRITVNDATGQHDIPLT